MANACDLIQDPAARAKCYALAQGASIQGSGQDPVLYWGPIKWGKKGGYQPQDATLHGGRYSAESGPGTGRTNTQTATIHGGRADIDSGPGSGASSGPTYQDSTKTVEDATTYIRQLLVDDRKSFYDIGDRMVHLGYLKPGYAPEDVEQAWTAAAEKAALLYQGGQGPKITVGQVLDLYSPTNAGKYSDLAGTSIGEQRIDRTATDINISSRSQIKGASRTVGQQALGRDLSDAELDKLVTKVQAAQSAAPSITHTTGTADDYTNKTTGGLDAGTYIEDQIRDNPDYAEHQAAAFYAPLLFNALGATV